MKIAGVPEPFNLPLKLAIEAGELPGVEYIDYPGGTGAMTQALADGDIDAAILLTEGALYDVVNGSSNRLTKVLVESPLVWGIHTGAGSTLKSPDDMAGRRVAISRFGSGSHLIAIVDAIDRGFAVDDMQFVVVDNINGARQALAAGDADIFLWEKHMTQPLVDSGEFRRIGEREVPWPAFVVSATRSLIESRAMELRRVLETAHGYAEKLRQRGDAAEVISTGYGITAEDATRWLATVRWHTGFERPDAALQTALRALQAQGSIASSDIDLTEVWSAI